jgi:hypothetical protein
MQLKNIKIKFNKEWKDYQNFTKCTDIYSDEIQGFEIESNSIIVQLFNETERQVDTW